MATKNARSSVSSVTKFGVTDSYFSNLAVLVETRQQ